MLYLDIETLQQDPYPWLIRPEAEIKVSRAIKDPEKIAAHRKEAAETQVDDLRQKSSLDPSVGGVIVVVGIGVEVEGTPWRVATLINETGDETGERVLLAKVSAGLLRYQTEPLVSWNGPFDWRYLGVRALRHGLHDLARRVRVPKPWGDRGHIDPAEAWRQGQRSGDCLWALDHVARVLGLEVDDQIDGSKVSAVWSQPDGPATVARHCAADVERLRHVTHALLAAGWLDLPHEEITIPIPPPRGSAEDLVARARRLQYTTDPTKVIEALTQAGIGTEGLAALNDTSPQAIHPALAEILISLPTLPTDQLRAYLVALGGRP